MTATDDPAELRRSTSRSSRRRLRASKPRPATLEGHFPDATIVTVLNGIGAEEVVRAHGAWPIVSGVTFMSGTRHSDTHVEYILDTETWLGPYEDTPFAVVQDIADTIVASGLKAEALPDLRPAQWSKLIFNASVNRDRRADGASARLPLRAGRRSPASSGTSFTGSSTRGRPWRPLPGSRSMTTRGR